MDENLENSQIVFAQRLASGDLTIRSRALKQLQSFIKKESKTQRFNKEALVKLCKGLHYTMWMQDKMLLQEELAENICNLLQLFSSIDQLLDFVKVFIESLSNEWPYIDRWRMDKFLMIVRRLFRKLFFYARQKNWDECVCDQIIKLFCETVISSVSNICESLKFHCAAIYLDELDHIGGLSENMVFTFLKPYANILQEKISDSFFQSVCSEIFDTILNDFSQQHYNNNENDFVSEGIKFNYKNIAEHLFEVGSLNHVSAKRRKRIYALSKKFELAAKGLDPFPAVEISCKKRKWSKIS